MDEAGIGSDLIDILDLMGKTVILAKMSSRDGHYERTKDHLYELIRATTSAYLAASKLHNDMAK